VPRWHEPRQNVFPSFGKGKQEQREKQGIGLAGGTMSRDEILQRIKELYKSNDLNCCDEKLIHETCRHREKCWVKASIEKKRQ